MYQSLRQKMKLSTITGRLISGESHFLWRLYTGVAEALVKKPPANARKIDKRSLFRKLSAVGATGEKVSDVLYQLMRSGRQFDKRDLVDCLKDLRKYGRYQHCLEILEWMEKGRIDYSDRDYALHLNIICKLKGIDEAEKYFGGIPPDAKNLHVYGALLNCYCTEKMIDKSLSLFKEMDDKNYSSNVLAFNNLMCLYVKVGQPEKVPHLVQEMKQRNIPLNNYTYSIWIQSYGCLGDLEGLEQVMHEVQEQNSIKEDWSIYSNLVTVYIDAGESEKAKSALNKMEELLDNSKNPVRIGYNHLISQYARTGDLESVNRAWNKLKSKFKVCQNVSYLNMLHALSRLDDIEGLKKCFREWELSYRSYDNRLPTVVICAYLRHDMLEEAQLLLKEAEDRTEQKINIAHVTFMNYYLQKRDFDSAVKHMDAAIATKWKPLAEKLDPFFEHFKEEKDVEGAEEFCRKLEKVQPLDSMAYSWLLQTYAAAERTAPEMRQRMEENGIDITTEHEELLARVSPN